MNLWNWKKKETFEPPRLIQYAESNWPFYEKGAAIVRAAIFYKGLDYGFGFNNSGRTPDSHGRCSGGKKDCHHCQTIDAAIEALEGMEWL